MKKEEFEKYIKNIENDETKLLKLQNEYCEGNIEESDLSKEQVINLIALFDNQIDILKKTNKKRKERILDLKKHSFN